MPVPADKWYEGLDFELGFWQNYLNTKGAQYAEDYRVRLDPNRPFNGMVEDAIRNIGSREIDLLDVGSGPLTSLGYVSKEFDIKITATDPLADAYSVLLREAGVTPPVKTQKCFGENLLQHFGSRRFHVCHSCNALDHSMDPLTILLAMAQLLHPHGLLYVRVHTNEGENTGYSGLHNWNFDKDKNNNLVLWRGSERYNINEELSDFVQGHVTDFFHRNIGASELIFIGYRKAI